MKKLIFVTVFLSIPLAALIVFSCAKEKINPAVKTEKTKPETPIEKANTCSCFISGFWGSCGVTCPIKHGVCLASCVRIKVGPFGIFGSMTSCTCGGAGAGGLVISEGTYFDDVNLVNLENVCLILKSHVGFEGLSLKLEALIQAIKNNDPGLIPIAQEFFDGLAGLSQEQVHTINPELRPLVDACGRE
ncbi:hypothetical protein [Fluviicola sp.]|uniref:hypothetical protein n=1 Tax=Fluviicola sp. TaxID=1917219 RepID=UPI0031DFD4E3